MATGITVLVRFSNGSIAYLTNDNVTDGATGAELVTANQGGDLSQVSGVTIGQAYTGLTATDACVIVKKQASAAGRLLWANFRGPDGAVIVPIDGGGSMVGQMIKLYKPVMMTTGVTIFAAQQSADDSATLVASLDVCSPTKCDNFTVTAVDGANTELKNKDNATIGQSMNGLVATQMTARYPQTVGLNNALAGVSALFVTASDGALKAMVPPQSNSAGVYAGPSITYPVRILQNDSAFVNSDT